MALQLGRLRSKGRDCKLQRVLINEGESMDFRFLATDNKARHNGVVAEITGHCSLGWRAMRIAEAPERG